MTPPLPCLWAGWGEEGSWHALCHPGLLGELLPDSFPSSTFSSYLGDEACLPDSGHLFLVSSANIHHPNVCCDSQEQILHIIFVPDIGHFNTVCSLVLQCLPGVSTLPQPPPPLLLFCDHTGVQGFCEAALRPICPGTSFTLLIHSWGALLCTARNV